MSASNSSFPCAGGGGGQSHNKLRTQTRPPGHRHRPPRRAALHMPGPARPGTGTDPLPDTRQLFTQNTPKCGVGFGAVGERGRYFPSGLAALQIETNSICDCKTTFPGFSEAQICKKKLFFFTIKSFNKETAVNNEKTSGRFSRRPPHLSPRQAGPGEPGLAGPAGRLRGPRAHKLFFSPPPPPPPPPPGLKMHVSFCG